jgi:hypothetical protein
MGVSRETDYIPQPYTPTPDGFERRLRAWVGLPVDSMTTPDAAGANAAPKEHGARDHTGGHSDAEESQATA